MSAPRYPKIDSLFERKDDFSVDESKLRRPEFLVPSEWIVTEKIDGMNIRISLEPEYGETYMTGGGVALPTVVTETKWEVKYYGRNENSQFPPLMLEHLQKTFTLEKMQGLWRCTNNCEVCQGITFGEVMEDWDEAAGEKPVLEMAVCPNLERYQITLYGEGYGAGIQKGGGYNENKTFRLFDVLIGETWLSRENVEDVALNLDIKCAPRLGENWEITEIVEAVRAGMISRVAHLEGTSGCKAEGIVAQTVVPLFNSRDQRLMFKLKTSDFIAGKR